MKKIKNSCGSRISGHDGEQPLPINHVSEWAVVSTQVSQDSGDGPTTGKEQIDSAGL